jgi:hypothetical protein
LEGEFADEVFLYEGGTIKSRSCGLSQLQPSYLTVPKYNNIVVIVDNAPYELSSDTEGLLEILVDKISQKSRMKLFMEWIGHEIGYVLSGSNRDSDRTWSNPDSSVREVLRLGWICLDNKMHFDLLHACALIGCPTSGVAQRAMREIAPRREQGKGTLRRLAAVKTR